MTLRDAIGDLPPVPGGQRAERLPYRPRPGGGIAASSDGCAADLPARIAAWIHDHITRAVRADDWEAYTGLEPGQTYADIPAHLQRYRTDIFTDKYKRLAWDELSRTITAHIAKDGYWYIHPEQHRTLSIREAARLQTFPDWFRFAGQPSHRFAQIGNAVPPLVAEAVGRALIDSMRQSRSDAPADVRRRASGSWSGMRASRRILGDGRASIPGSCSRPSSASTDRRPPTSAARFARSRGRARASGARSRIDRRGAALASAGLSAHARSAAGRAAEALVELFDGDVPADDLELRAIPGVGDSLAKTVLCFGHGRSAVPLHTAAARVATRWPGAEHAGGGSSGSTCTGSRVRRARTRAFNAAVLHLGTTVCRPADPQCAECPLGTHCATARGASRRPPIIARLSRMSEHRVIPSARRLMESLRDIGYDLPAAVADLVDNSIDADAENVRIDVGHDLEAAGSGSPTTASG